MAFIVINKQALFKANKAQIDKWYWKFAKEVIFRIQIVKGSIYCSTVRICAETKIKPNIRPNSVGLPWIILVKKYFLINRLHFIVAAAVMSSFCAKFAFGTSNKGKQNLTYFIRAFWNCVWTCEGNFFKRRVNKICVRNTVVQRVNKKKF